ncbi:MAG: hypothetical protein K2I48_09075, partial [Muribaculaceae bacterium]|nr:hypothetical protein [Muribaculaceae bacterium]
PNTPKVASTATRRNITGVSAQIISFFINYYFLFGGISSIPSGSNIAGISIISGFSGSPEISGALEDSRANSNFYLENQNK